MSDELATLIRTRREHLGLTRAELARLVGRAPSTVGSWEQGRSRPAPETLETLNGVLGLGESGEIPVAPGDVLVEVAAEPSAPSTPSFVLDLSDFEEVVTAAERSEMVESKADEAPERSGGEPDDVALALEVVKAPTVEADEEPMVAPQMTPTTVVVAPTRRRAARAASRLAGPATIGTVQPVRTDADPMYRVRALITLAAVGLMGIVFLWAASEAGAAIRDLLSAFLAPFR